MTGRDFAIAVNGAVLGINVAIAGMYAVSGNSGSGLLHVGLAVLSFAVLVGAIRGRSD